MHAVIKAVFFLFSKVQIPQISLNKRKIMLLPKLNEESQFS